MFNTKKLLKQVLKKKRIKPLFLQEPKSTKQVKEL